MEKDFEIIEEMISSYMYSQMRDMENSNSITPSFYVNEGARIHKEYGDAMYALNRIKEKCGIE